MKLYSLLRTASLYKSISRTWFFLFFILYYFIWQGINVGNVVAKKHIANMCTSAITIQKHKHKEGGTLSQEFGFMLNQDSTDAIQVKKDWTGDNSCPFELRSNFNCFLTNIVLSFFFLWWVSLTQTLSKWSLCSWHPSQREKYNTIFAKKKSCQRCL